MRKLAVVIPTYNRARLARRAVESVLAQDGFDRDQIEVIVVDDGSGDETPELIGSLPGIRYIRQENQGLSAARNTGILATEAEFVAFLDDDDRFLPGKIARDLRGLADEPDIDLLYSNARRVSPEGEDLGLCLVNHRLPGSPLRGLLIENFLLVQTVVVRRKVLLEAGLFDRAVRLCEDVDLWVRVAARTSRFRYEPEPLVEVLRFPESMSGDPVRMQEAQLAVGRRHAPVIREALGNPRRDWWLSGPYYRLGRVYYERGDWGKAREALRAALAACPSHRGALLYLGMAGFGARGRRLFQSGRRMARAVRGRLARLGLIETRW